MAYSIASFLFLIPTAISAVLFVEGSHDYPLKENLVKSLKLMAMLMIPSLLVVFFFGDKILLVFNKEYAAGAFELLRLLAIASLFASATSVYVAIKRVQKDLKTINVLMIVVSVALLASSYIGLVGYGLTGLGYAWAFTYLAVCPFILLSTLREWGGDISHYWRKIWKDTRAEKE